jgi:acetyl esterase/lipase
VCVSANYRLRPPAGFTDQLTDLEQVMTWVREHGAQYGADPRVLFVAGSSAGGHLAAFSALSGDEPVSAAICLYGYFGSYAGLDEQSSPRAHVRADAPPFFIAQGDRDTFSPRFVEIARGFAGELRDASSDPVAYAELPGAQHAFDLLHSIRFEAVVDGIEAFTAWVRSRPAQPTRTRTPSRS